MEIKVSKNDKDMYLIELSGSLDLYNSNQLKELFMKMIENKTDRVVMNLEKVDKINSAGIGALIYIASTLRKLGCPLVLVIPEGPILQVLEVTRLKTYFTIVPSMREIHSMIADEDGTKDRK